LVPVVNKILEFEAQAITKKNFFCPRETFVTLQTNKQTSKHIQKFLRLLTIFLYILFHFGQGLLSIEVSRSPSDTSHWIGLLWTNDLPDNTQQSRQTSMSPVGFEPTLSSGQRPQTYVSDRAATGTGIFLILGYPNSQNTKKHYIRQVSRWYVHPCTGTEALYRKYSP